MCCEVLSQLKETIPDSIDIRKLTAVVKETGRMLARISDKDLFEMKEIDNTASQFTIKFYNLLVSSQVAARSSLQLSLHWPFPL